MAVVGSRCVYYPSLLEREREIERMGRARSQSIIRLTNADTPSYRKSTIHFLLAKVNPSTPSSSERPTPRSWLTNKMMEDCATTFCTFRRSLPTPHNKKKKKLICRLRLPFPPPSLALTLRSFGFAGECLGQHSGGDQEADLGDGRGYRASRHSFSSFLSFSRFQYSFKRERDCGDAL